jgi:hypothetical protein
VGEIWTLQRGGYRSWTKVYNEELHDFYFSLNIIKMTKSMKIRLTGFVARRERKMHRYTQKFWQKTWRKEDTWKARS